MKYMKPVPHLLAFQLDETRRRLNLTEWEVMEAIGIQSMNTYERLIAKPGELILGEIITRANYWVKVNRRK
jgi:hypothetical protein